MLLLFDGPKKYGTAAVTANTIAATLNGITYLATGGRDGEPAYGSNSTSSQQGAYYQLPSSYGAGETLILGRHLYLTSASGAGGLLALQGGLQTTSSNWWATLTVNASSQLEWRTGNESGTVRATSTLTLTADTHYFMEVKVTLQTGATGSVIVNVNEVEYINATGIATVSSLSPEVQTVRFRNNSGNPGARFDCIYVCDGTGSFANDFLGPVKEQVHFPSADTADADFTPSTGTDGYAMVDDETPDDDTTYIASDTAGALSLFEHDAITLTSDVKGIAPFVRLKKDAAGVMGAKVVLKVGSTEHKGDLYVPGTAYVYVAEFYDHDPDTSLAWAANDVNNSQIGVEATTTA